MTKKENKTMLRNRQRKQNMKKDFIYKVMNLAVTSIILTFVFTVTALAAGEGGDGSGAITQAQSLLSKAATAGGGLWAVWGLVQLGMSIKDHNGPGIGGAVWQIVGGGVIIAAGQLIGNLSLTMSP